MPDGVGYSSTLRVASREAARGGSSLENPEKAMAPSENSNEEELPRLVAYLNGIWDRNRRGKQEVKDQMLENFRAYRNSYDSAKLEAIKQEGGSKVFMGLTRTKCRHGISWLMDIFTSAEKPWKLEPTPVPDPSAMARAKVLTMVSRDVNRRLQEGAAESGAVTPELMAATLEAVQPLAEEALDLELNERTGKMDKLVHDQLIEGGFFREFRKMIRDLVILKAGIVKGPVPRKVDTFTWVEKGEGKFVREKQVKTKPFWYRISPFDLYPTPDTDDMEAPLVERMKLQQPDLVALKGEVGYWTDAINEIILDFSRYAGRTDGEEALDTERSDLEEREDGLSGSAESDQAVAKEFTLKVPGQYLKDYTEPEVLRTIPGAPEKIDEAGCYPMDIILLGNKIIFMKFDSDPIDRVRYFKYGWDEVNGSFWYEGVPETMSDLQKVCNASARALVNNLAVASGPMAEINVDRLVPGEDLQGIKPRRIFQVTGGAGNTKAVNFFSPDSNAGDLLKVYDAFAKLADEYTGIPAYSYGNDRVAGAGRTMGGLSMLMSAAARGIKEVILGLDDNVIKPLVLAQVDWNMKYHDDPSVKGDHTVVSTGAVALMVREQMAERRMEFLNATNNDTDLQLTGFEGRANVLREVAHSLELSSSTVVKTPEDVRTLATTAEQTERQAQEATAELQQAREQLELQKLQSEVQATQFEAQLAAAKLELERQKLALAGAKLQVDAEKVRGDQALKSSKQNTDARLAALEYERNLSNDRVSAATQGMDSTLKASEFLNNQADLDEAVADEEANMLEEDERTADNETTQPE